MPRSALVRRLLALLVAFAIVGAACGGGDDDASDGGETQADGTGSEDGGDDAATDGATDDSGDGAAEDGAGDDGAVQSTPTPSSDEPVPGGTLRIGLEAETDGLNPGVNRFAVSALMMGNAVFDTLAATGEDGNPVPFLAESFETPDDGATWIMKLRPGITFHDGTPLDSAAIVRNFEAQTADLLIQLAVLPFLDPETPIEVIDDLTVQYNLAVPAARFASALTGQLGMVASPAWLDAALDDPALNQEPVGTGPFIFDSRTQDQVTRFVRNDNWWNGEVYLDAVEFYPITDPARRADQLLAGDLEGLHTSDAETTQLLIDEESNGIVNILDDTAEEDFAYVNTSVPPFDDIRVRQALTYSTALANYRDFIGVGLKRNADSFFPPESPYYNPDVVQEGDQPELAGPLIEEYCAEVPDQCTDGKVNVELQYSGPSVIQDRIADLLIEGWSPFFNVTKDVKPQDDHITDAATGAYQIITWRQMGAPDPSNDHVWLLCSSIGGLSLNWPRLCDESRDALLYEERATSDEARRAEIWKEVAAKIQADYAYIFFTRALWDNAFIEQVQNVCGVVSPEGVPLLCTENGRNRWGQVWLAG